MSQCDAKYERSEADFTLSGVYNVEVGSSVLSYKARYFLCMVAETPRLGWQVQG